MEIEAELAWKVEDAMLKPYCVSPQIGESANQSIGSIQQK